MEIAVEISPICACCREKLHTSWRVWIPGGTVTCGQPMCVGWAESGGKQLYSSGLVAIRKGPVRPKKRILRCRCGKELPPARDCFVQAGASYCSLTCMQRA